MNVCGRNFSGVIILARVVQNFDITNIVASCNDGREISRDGTCWANRGDLPLCAFIGTA